MGSRYLYCNHNVKYISHRTKNVQSCKSNESSRDQQEADRTFFACFMKLQSDKQRLIRDLSKTHLLLEVSARKIVNYQTAASDLLL